MDLFLRNQFDFEDFWPEFSRHEQAVTGSIVSDTVENGVGVGPFGFWKTAGEIDPAQNSAVNRRNARDAIRLPDVRVDLASYPLQFVQLCYGSGAILHRNPSDFFQRGAIPNADIGGTIAHVNLFAVVGEAPAFAGIVEAAQHLKAGFVVNESGLRLPGQLQNLLIQDGDTLTEERLRKIVSLNNPPAVEIKLSHRRSAEHACAFV